MKVDYTKIQKAAWFTPLSRGRWGIVVNWIGNPGQGKTAVLENLAKTCGFYCKVLIAGQREPSDFLGIPYPEKNGELGKRMEFLPPDFVAQANHHKNGSVIYLDELNHASPAVQGACQRVVHEGVVGDVQLEGHVRFIISVNPDDQAATAGGSSISVALANRIAHIRWEDLKADDWTEFMLNGAGDQETEVIDPKEHEKFVMSRWKTAFAKAIGLTTTFAKRNSRCFNQVPDVAGDQASGAFPTPRSWEFATRAYASATIHDLNFEETLLLLGGLVGQDSAREFMNFVNENDLQDPIEILNGDVKIEFDRKRLDRANATISTMWAVICSEKDEKLKSKYASNFMFALADVSKGGGKDLTMIAAERVLKQVTAQTIVLQPNVFRSQHVKDHAMAGLHELVTFKKQFLNEAA